MRIRTLTLSAAVACTFSTSNALACESCTEGDQGHIHLSSTADDHAPIGVMGDHMHKKGEWMLSYRAMSMHMDGSRDGTNSLSPTTIATTYANRFSSVAGQPATLRVVPTEMDMNMHMLGAMYAPTDWMTLMAMFNYIDKDMKHITFAGGSGTTELGNFTTRSSGWGDTKISSLIKLHNTHNHKVHLNMGVSLPTGSIKEEDSVLTPMGMTPTVRLPYGMQLGTGTYDLLPGITYNGHKDDWSWGAQYSAEIRLESENDQGYSWGDKHSVTAWGSYQWAPWISTSLRLTGTTQDAIDGIDSQIVLPVQTADPDNYGGKTLDLSFGVNLIGTQGAIKGHRIAIEATTPLYRNLNGPQLENDFTVVLGWQYAF